MDREDAERVVREVIFEHLVEANVEPSTKWKDIRADSLDLVEMLLMAEDKVGKPLDSKELGNVSTVGDMVNLLVRLV